MSQGIALDKQKGTFGRQKFSFCWQGQKDLNLRMTESESVALPLGDAPI